MDLTFIGKEQIFKASEAIDLNNIPSSHPRSDYWVLVNGSYYPFKYLVEEAGKLAGKKHFTSNDFSSDHPERNYIASLGFNIRFIKSSGKVDSRYWAGAYYWGVNDDDSKLQEFIENGLWGTDSNKNSKKGKKIYGLLNKIEVNDRIAIRTLDRKRSTIKVEAIGTVSNIGNAESAGLVKVVWDLNPFLYEGKRPMGIGSGTWWNTLTEIKRDEDVRLIFNEGNPSEKISRICWNTNGWIKPSGSIGKSKNPDTHEGQYGYGHEEWLLDVDKVYNGYHYGFLEPIHQNRSLYTGETFNISLYSIDGASKTKYWIGKINNVEVIDDPTSLKVVSHYKKEKWLNEMVSQLEEVEADAKSFRKWMNETLFNVRFRPEDLDLLDEPLPLSKSAEVVSSTRYILLNKIIEPNFENDEEGEFNFKPQKPSDNRNYNSSYFSKGKKVELKLKHKEIIDGLYSLLCELHGKDNVSAELKTGFGTKMDLTVKTSSGLIIYEVKTYNTIKANIREAFGQLLEYSYWPDKDLAKELIIVSHLNATDAVMNYMDLLRNKFKLPIYYQKFDTIKNELSAMS